MRLKGFFVPMNRCIKFVVHGVSRPLTYVVEKTEWDRVTSFFEQYRPGSLPTFVEFVSVNGRVIHINAKLVLTYQGLISVRQQDNFLTSDRAEKQNRVSFHVRGMAEPLHFDDLDEGEIVDLQTGLEAYDPRSHHFVSFSDAADEPHAIRGEDLILVESPNYRAKREEDL